MRWWTSGLYRRRTLEPRCVSVAWRSSQKCLRVLLLVLKSQRLVVAVVSGGAFVSAFWQQLPRLDVSILSLATAVPFFALPFTVIACADIIRHFYQLVMRSLEISVLRRGRGSLANPLAATVIVPMAMVSMFLGALFPDNVAATMWL